MNQSPRMCRWHSQIVNELRNQYNLAKEPTILELKECSADTITTLLDVTGAILAATPVATPSTNHSREIATLRSPRGSISAPASPKTEMVELAPAMSLAATKEKLHALREHAHQMFRSFHHSQVPRYWRRLYTDTSILMVLAELLRDTGGADEFYKSLIGLLDEAIVITNAPGAGRSDMCHDAIAHIQEEYLPLTDIARPSTSTSGASGSYPDSFEDNSVPPDIRASKRPKRVTRGAASLNGSAAVGVPASPLPATSTRQIHRVTDTPTLMEYKTRYYESPFIIPRYAADWPACSTWGNPQYLRMVGGLGRKVPVEVSRPGQDYTSDQWTTRMMDWEEFIDTLHARSAFGAKARARAQASAMAAAVPRPATPVDPNVPRKRGRPPGSKTTQAVPVPITIEEWSGETQYLAQHDLINQFPELRSDIIIPDYVYSLAPAPSWFPDYKPPRVEGEHIINNWIGPKGSITPAHKDPYYNCYVQVIGKKTVWLAPPDFIEEMYPYDPTTDHVPESSASRGTAPVNDTPSSSSSPARSTTSELSSSPSGPPSMYQASPPPVSSSRMTSAVAGAPTSMLSNTSRVPVFNPPADSKAKFPLFHQHVVQHALSAVLEPGDVLVFPPGWWHAMRTEETSASVSIWF